MYSNQLPFSTLVIFPVNGFLIHVFCIVFNSSIRHLNSTALILHVSLYLVQIEGPQRLWPSGPAPDLYDSKHRRKRDLNHRPTQFGFWSKIHRKKGFVSILYLLNIWAKGYALLKRYGILFYIPKLKISHQWYGHHLIETCFNKGYYDRKMTTLISSVDLEVLSKLMHILYQTSTLVHVKYKTDTTEKGRKLGSRIYLIIQPYPDTIRQYLVKNERFLIFKICPFLHFKFNWLWIIISVTFHTLL